MTKPAPENPPQNPPHPPQKKPVEFRKPAYWDNAPAPKPEQAAEQAGAEDDPDGLSPTRYGDWVKNGIAIDF